MPDTTAAPARRGPSPTTRAVAVALLVGAALVGLARLPGELSRQSDTAAGGRAIQRIDSVPVLAPGERRTKFLASVRRAVPAGESVLIVQPVTPLPPLEGRRGGRPGVCGYSASRVVYFWLVYALESRPSTCDPAARWWLYYGVRPGPLPPGATSRRFAEDYVLVSR